MRMHACKPAQGMASAALAQKSSFQRLMNDAEAKRRLLEEQQKQARHWET